MAKPTICSIDGCCQPVRTRGWCAMHYMRWWKWGDPLWKQPYPCKGKLCAVEGCLRPHCGHGFCRSHLRRWKLYGDPLASTGTQTGDAQRFLRDVVLPYDGDDCIQWPFNTIRGWARIFSLGKGSCPVGRVICNHLYGPPPSQLHQAAHSCGNGAAGCVTPKHLRWATCAENQAEKIQHGHSVRGERHPNAKLTDSDVREIRALKGMMTAAEIGERFGVNKFVVGRVLRRQSWAWLV